MSPHPCFAGKNNLRKNPHASLAIPAKNPNVGNCMSPRNPRSMSRALACLAVIASGLVINSAVAATPGRGTLKPEERSPEPTIESASDEGQEAIAKMKLPAGLKAALWAAEPMLANPVAFNIDAKGRVFVAETHRYRTSTLDIRDYMWMLEDDLANRTQDEFMATVLRNFGDQGVKDLSRESERLVLVEDTNGDGVADKSGVYADDFRTPLDGIASGVMIHRGDVWFTNIPSLWKFGGKDKAETRTEMFKGFGLRFSFTGHDFHGLVLGPDGRIYFSIGDRGATVYPKEGGVISTPDTGSVFRCWPDGSGLELFATGLRNPQSLIFNEYGDLLTGDNDSDLGDEERLVHVVEHGDSGWRIGYQHAPRGAPGQWNAEKMWQPRHEGQPAFIIPPICNVEDGPSGLTYYPGTGLTPEYAHTIFLTHFKGSITNSGIYTYRVKPEGASYAIDTAAPFLTGALPTDVRFGPDGKLYYSDWAEGWPKSRRGRIYTISDPNRANDPALKEIQQIIGSDFTKKSDDELAKLLAHADWRIRLEAQYSLAERAAAGITRFAAAAKGDNELARRHAVWGLGQIARKNPAATEALRALLTSADDEVRAQAFKTLGDLRDAASAQAAVDALSHKSARVRFFAAEALGKLKHAAATPALLAALRANKDLDGHLRHALAIALVTCATPEQLLATAKDESRSVRLAAVLALRRLGHAGITTFLADADPLVAREAVLAINDAPITAAFPAIAAYIAKPVNDEPIMLRALNANFRLGTPAHAAALGAFAGSEASPVLRKEALTLLGLWSAPPARDRIVGIFRPLADKTRPAGPAIEALTPTLAGIFAAHTPDTVQQAAIDAIVALGAKNLSPVLRDVVADQAESSSIRVAALKALDQLGDDQLATSAGLAAQSDVPELRLAALPITSRLAPDTAVSALTALIERGTIKEQQTAFKALGAAKDPKADEVLLAQLQRLEAGQIPAQVQLDVLDAAAQRSDERVKQALAARDARLAQDPDPIAPFRVALEGGSAAAGNQLFYRHPVLQCIRCHRVGEGPGGEAGPNLGGLGTRATREYVLESIIKPSAKIAPGFEIVSVTKTVGDEPVAGTVVRRDAQGIRLKLADGNEVEIPTAEIKSIESAPSAMPEIAALVLTKAEIRDLVEAAMALRAPGRPRTAAAVPRALQKLDGIERISPPSGH